VHASCPFEIENHFQYTCHAGNDRFLRSLGLSSLGLDPMSPPGFGRAVLRRLLAALRARDPVAVLDAGALASALVAAERDAAAAVRRALAILDVVLLDPGADVADGLRERVERTADALSEGSATSAADVGRRLAHLWREAADGFAPAASPVALANAIQEFLATNLAERVRLQDLARTLGYSPSHVSAVIHRMTGRRFTQLRRDMQLERAMFLLRRGVPVKRSALDAGFNDPAYFSRVFARRFGVPPSRWRDAAGR
jgi:AraC-like DNA-binding protein